METALQQCITQDTSTSGTAAGTNKKSQGSNFSREVPLANFLKIHVSIYSADNLKPAITLTVMNFYSRDCSVPNRILTRTGTVGSI